MQVADVSDYVWLYDLLRREGRRVAVQGTAAYPVFARDSSSLFLLRSSGKDSWILVQQPLAGGEARELSRDYLRPGAGSREDRVAVFGIRDDGTARVGLLDSSKTPAETTWLPGQAGLLAVSPDGRWLAFTSFLTGRYEVWVQPAGATGRVRQISTDGGIEPLWCGDQLVYRRGGQWWASTVTNRGDDLTWTPSRIVFETDFIDTPGVSYGLSPDCRRLLVVKRSREPVRNKLRFVTNFSAELNRLVP